MRRAKARGRESPGRVRIIGGSLRGSILNVPERAGLRPTPGRVRETLFNWLQGHLAGARCLDLFAGTGALGIEALSRGAAAVCFVERDAGLADALRAQLERLDQHNWQVVCADAPGWLRADPPAQPYDLVFLDPPFADGLWSALAGWLESAGWLAPQAFIHLEMPLAGEFVAPPAWSVWRRARAGEVAHALYRRIG
jgi:16S rRNA (guanine966-N2)-methyltransferase